jgi:hypothetical protein
MARTPLFRTIADDVDAQLVAILTLESRPVPEFFFDSNPQFKELDVLPRLAWTHMGGSFVATANLATGQIEDPVTPPNIPPFFRKATAQIRIWASDDEGCEHILERLVIATRRSRYQGNFNWPRALYRYPSATTGVQLKNGVSVIELHVPIDLPMSSSADGENVIVTLLDPQLRAGLEDVLDTTTVGQPQFDVNEWT